MVHPTHRARVRGELSAPLTNLLFLLQTGCSMNSSFFLQRPHFQHQEKSSPLFILPAMVGFDRLSFGLYLFIFIPFSPLFYFSYLFVSPSLGQSFPYQLPPSSEYKTAPAMGWISPLGPGSVSMGREGKDLVQHEKAKYICSCQHYRSKLNIWK